MWSVVIYSHHWPFPIFRVGGLAIISSYFLKIERTKVIGFENIRWSSDSKWFDVYCLRCFITFSSRFELWKSKKNSLNYDSCCVGCEAQESSRLIQPCINQCNIPIATDGKYHDIISARLIFLFCFVSFLYLYKLGWPHSVTHCVGMVGMMTSMGVLGVIQRSENLVDRLHSRSVDGWFFWWGI